MGLSKFFRFTGIRPPSEVRTAVHLCDILVSPRTSGTNTPLKIYSYLRSGKPIVATNLYTHTQVLNEEVSVFGAARTNCSGRGYSLASQRPWQCQADGP